MGGAVPPLFLKIHPTGIGCISQNMPSQGANLLWISSSNKKIFFLSLLPVDNISHLIDNLIYLLLNVFELESERSRLKKEACCYRGFSSQGAVWFGCINRWPHPPEVLSTAACPGESSSLFHQDELCFLVTISKIADQELQDLCGPATEFC